MLVNAEEVAEASRFFIDVLGLRLTEQVLDGNGHQLGVWLAGRTNSPHDIAIVNGPNGALHHWAYWLDDWDHIRKAADTSPTTACRSTRARRATASPAATPSTSSTRSASATRCSPAATGSIPDAEIITWTEQEFGKGLFYYENVVSQRFLRMHT